MPYQDQKPRIEEQELMDYGRRQYQDFAASHRRLKQNVAGRYGHPGHRLNSRQLLSIAAAVLLLIVGYWQLRPVTNSPQNQLASFIELEKSPLPTLGLSGYRTENQGQESVDLRLALQPYAEGDYLTAIATLENLLEQSAAPQQLRLYLGHAYFQQKDYTQAALALEQAVGQLDPTTQAAAWTTARYWRAKALAANGQCDQASADLQFLSRPGNEYSTQAQELQLICQQLSPRP